MVSDKMIFNVFPIYAYVKHVTPRGGAIFSPKGGNLNKHGSPPDQVMLHLKYQGSRPYGFRQDFFNVSYLSQCKTCDPWGWAVIGLRGII